MHTNSKKRKSIIFFLLCISMGITSHNAFAKCSRVINVPIPGLNTAQNNVDDSKRGDLTAHVLQLMGTISQKLDCQFNYLSVPKSRQEHLFRNGDADILLMATKTPKRDEVGLLIPIIQMRPAIISNVQFGSLGLTLKKIQDDQQIHLVLVRGFDYGDEYNNFIQVIDKLKRVSYEPDAFSVARRMSYKNNVVTIMGPSIFDEVINSEKALNTLIGNIRYDEIEEFAWIDFGIYISKKTLLEKDFNYLKTHFPLFVGSDHIWNWIQKRYSKDIVRIGFRQINSSSQKKSQ